MSKLFVTVLGTGNYFDCYYSKGDQSFRTPFVQEALAKFLYIDQNINFDMKILLTEKAYQKNYIGKGKLQETLAKYNIIPKLVMIPEGKDSDELWTIFDKVSDTIDESANELCQDKSSLDVTIDITHSLRNIPMQIVVAMNYLTLFNDINLEGIYYGAFELGEIKIDDNLFSNKDILDKLYSLENINPDVLDKLKSAHSVEDLDEDTKNEIIANSRNYKGCTITDAPICNLNVYYDLLKWTNAINSFIQCGNTTEIKTILSLKKKSIFSKNTQNMSQDEKEKLAKDKNDINLMNAVVEALDNFANCISTCRGMYNTLDKSKKSNKFNSIKFAAEALDKSLQKLNENISIKPLKKLFNLVKKEIEPFIGKNTLEIGIATVNWCIKYNLYQQAYTALDETLKTLLCFKLNLKNRKTGKFDENEYENREEIANAILTCNKINKENISFKFKSIKDEEEKEKVIEKSKDFVWENIESLKQYDEDFYIFVESVKNYRNDINHFGFNINGAAGYKNLSDKLKEFRDKLVHYAECEFPWIEK